MDTVETRYGFSLSQLIHYTIEPLDAANDGPPQKITLGFSTADVIVSGWRLDNFAEELRSHKGGIVKTLPAPDRYKNLSPHTSAVADITIKPVGKQGS